MKIIVIGGGPAGMAAAASAKYAGVEEVLLLERYDYLGGVLPQCIHNGFGTQIYNRDYTGGEYAHLWRGLVDAAGVTVKKGTSVLSLEKSGGLWKVSCVSSELGAETLEAEAVIVATGCRERTLPQLGIPGSRPAGVFTAGAARPNDEPEKFSAGKNSSHSGFGRHRIDYGTAHDFGRHEGQADFGAGVHRPCPEYHPVCRGL